MNTAAEVLLIIVSSVLAIFLLVAIIASVWVIKLLKQVRNITARAENVADSVEAAAAAFERTASPLAILKVIGNIVDQASRMRKRKDK
jgi:predicted PurR-regulated permease PerM